MNDMKRVACLIASLVFAFNRSYPDGPGVRDTTGLAETISIRSDFAVDIEYPNFLVSVLAHLAGAHTDSLKFVEWDIKTPFLRSYLLHLTDENDQRWFEIASDSAFPSFIKVPLEDRTDLVPSAVDFFRDALAFFRNTSSDTLHATFVFGHDTLSASVFHSSASMDSGSVVTTFSHIETWNKRTGEEYNSADVIATTQDGYTTFRHIKVFLKKSSIVFQLASVRVTVIRSRY